MSTNHEELFLNLKRTLAAFIESTEVDVATHIEQLEEIRDTCDEAISLIENTEDDEDEGGDEKKSGE